MLVCELYLHQKQLIVISSLQSSICLLQIEIDYTFLLLDVQEKKEILREPVILMSKRQLHELLL